MIRMNNRSSESRQRGSYINTEAKEHKQCYLTWWTVVGEFLIGVRRCTVSQLPVQPTLPSDNSSRQTTHTGSIFRWSEPMKERRETLALQFLGVNWMHIAWDGEVTSHFEHSNRCSPTLSLACSVLLATAYYFRSTYTWHVTDKCPPSHRDAAAAAAASHVLRRNFSNVCDFSRWFVIRGAGGADPATSRSLEGVGYFPLLRRHSMCSV